MKRLTLQFIAASFVIGLNIPLAFGATTPGTTTPSTTTASAASPAQIRDWTVQSGDTLWKISYTTGVPIQNIVDYNNISNMNALSIGQVIQVPPVYIVKPGDSLWQISQAAHVTMLNLEAANGITNPNDIQVGTDLNIPPTNSKPLYYFGSKETKEVALTFDDGPDNNWTPQILSILRQYHVKATFFIVGVQAQRYPDMVRQIVADGNAIGNHSYDHANFTTLTPLQIKAELDKTDMALYNIVGYYPAIFRPPYGSLTTTDVQEISSMGYKVVKWSVDTVDWNGTPVWQIMANVNQEIYPGGIILEHCFGGKGGDLSNTVQALPQIITDLKAQGYRFVTIPQLLDVPAEQ